MTLRFTTRAFMDREQECLLITYLPFRIIVCTANQVFDNIINGQLKTPYILQGESGDAAIGGFTTLDKRLRDILYNQTIELIEANRERGLRTGIIPALSPKTRPEHGALLLLVAYNPEDEHVAEQKSYTNYENIIREFFDAVPGFFH